MTAPLWVRELADLFWAEAGGPGPFPRCLRPAIDRGWPLTVVDLPRLRLAGVVRWLWHNGVAMTVEETDRPLRACVVAREGWGFVFLDADDDVPERRFSLAHEVAHFLRDYWQPRREAERRLGPAVREVLDGLRPPRPEERLRGLVAGLRLGFHTHLLERRTGLPDARVARAERDADRLAYELLAPADAVLTGLVPEVSGLETRLREEFGLPPGPAGAYATLLAGRGGPDPLLWRLTGRKKT